jgi:hypothetical protein
MTPEEIAAQIVNAFTGDEYWIDKQAAIVDVAAALRARGDARAAQERARCISICTTFAARARERATAEPTLAPVGVVADAVADLIRDLNQPDA